VFVIWCAVLAPALGRAGSTDDTQIVPAPDVVPWFVARRMELTLVLVLSLAVFALDLWRQGTSPSPRKILARLRLAALLALFGSVAVWGLETQRRRTARREWQRPLHVAVTLLSTEHLEERVATAFDHASQRAASLMSRERKRHDSRDGMPFWFHVFGPTTVAREPPQPSGEQSLMGRAKYRYALGAYLADVDRKTQMMAGLYDIRIYVVAQPPADKSALRFVEGIGEAGGELGVVRVDLDMDMVDAAWTAVLHELLHTVGATDKYDSRGHALPEGLAEPELLPTYPQHSAEIMVGEVPLAPGSGRTPKSLAEVRVGPVTASEIGWR
jgi:hypothetical protein